MDTDEKKKKIENEISSVFDELAEKIAELERVFEIIEQLEEKIKAVEKDGEERLLESEKYYKDKILVLQSAIEELVDQIEQISAQSQNPPVFTACFLRMGEDIKYTTEDKKDVIIKNAWVLAKGKKQTIGIEPTVDLKELKRGREVMVRKDPQTNELVSLVKVLPFGLSGGEDIFQVKRIEKKKEGDFAIIETPGAMKHLSICEDCEPLEPGDRVLVSREYDLVVCHAPAMEDEVDRKKIDPVGYKDVGGLDKQIMEIKEVVELPFKQPERFEKLGIRAPRSILLKGPPGTGKTLLARVVANETDSVFFSRSGSDFNPEGYRGADVAKLDLFFEEAEKARKRLGKKCAIIFIDEIDILVPVRDKLHSGQHDVETLVNAFLARMEGLKGRGEVVVIGATNKPEKMDVPARQRFDIQVEVPVPTDEGRKKILEIHTRKMPLSTGFDLGKIIDKTHGFVGRDIEHLCIKAGLKADRRVRDTSENPEISEDDFIEVIDVDGMKPEGLGASVITKTGVSFEDIAGLDGAKEELKSEIDALLGRDEFSKFIGRKPRKGLLLVSNPGLGKTLLAKAVAGEYKMNFIPVKSADVHTMWYGMSAQTLTAYFQMAKLHAPCILFLDELDTLLPSRGGGAGSPRADEKVVTAFNVEMDGVESMEGVVVIGATNRPDLVDPACLRRLCPTGKPVYLEPLDEAARVKCFEIHSRNFEHTLDKEDIDFAELGKLTKERKIVIIFGDGAHKYTLPFSGDEIRGACEEAQRIAEGEFKKTFPDDFNERAKEFRVLQKHFEQAIVGKLKEERKEEAERVPDIPSGKDLEEIAESLNLDDICFSDSDDSREAGGINKDDEK
ncbi:AAA family ATPase [Patescibacteria group bacterium]|nr:AAA family ATPase [Patescibacteria group bacterium]